MIKGRRKIISFFILVLIALLLPQRVDAQRIAIKTNTLYWATLSPNVGLDLRLSRKFSLGFETVGNPMKIGDYKLNFFAAGTELRYWLSRTMVHHFVGVTTWMDTHNLRIKDTNYKGDAFAYGLTYGYVWALTKRVNLEATLGLGAVHIRNIEWDEGELRPTSPNEKKIYMGPIKAGISFSYFFK